MLHLINPYFRNPEIKARLQRNWNQHYRSGLLKPCYFYPERTSKSIGDSRELPFIRDMLQYSERYNDDWVLLANSDIAFVSDLDKYIELGYSHRRDFYKPIRVPINSDHLARIGEPFIGADIFILTKDWISRNKIPDLLLGYEGWDWVFKCLLNNKLQSLGWHEYHGTSYWYANRACVGQQYNRRLVYEWTQQYGIPESIKREWLTISDYNVSISKT